MLSWIERIGTTWKTKIEAIRDLITTIPAVSPVDAAIQAHAATAYAALMADSVMPDEELKNHWYVVERVFYSFVPVLAEAAGINLEAMHFTGDLALPRYRFGNVWAGAKGASA